ncbi:hypothetical protein ACFLR5_01075 [Elusimicrobiota bacterium]
MLLIVLSAGKLSAGWYFSAEISLRNCDSQYLITGYIPTLPSLGPFPTSPSCNSFRNQVLAISYSAPYCAAYGKSGCTNWQTCHVGFTVSACTGSDDTAIFGADPGSANISSNLTGKPMVSSHHTSEFGQLISENRERIRASQALANSRKINRTKKRRSDRMVSRIPARTPEERMFQQSFFDNSDMMYDMPTSEDPDEFDEDAELQEGSSMSQEELDKLKNERDNLQEKRGKRFEDFTNCLKEKPVAVCESTIGKELDEMDKRIADLNIEILDGTLGGGKEKENKTGWNDPNVVNLTDVDENATVALMRDEPTEGTTPLGNEIITDDVPVPILAPNNKNPHYDLEQDIERTGWASIKHGTKELMEKAIDKGLQDWVKTFKGKRHLMKLMNKIPFGTYNDKIKAVTEAEKIFSVDKGKGLVEGIKSGTTKVGGVTKITSMGTVAGYAAAWVSAGITITEKLWEINAELDNAIAEVGLQHLEQEKMLRDQKERTEERRKKVRGKLQYKKK